MPLILLILALVILRYFEVWRFADLSWWWIVGLMVVGFIWFEFIEKLLGLDKRKAHDLNEKRRKERVRQSFDKRKGCVGSLACRAHPGTCPWRIANVPRRYKNRGQSTFLRNSLNAFSERSSRRIAMATVP